MTPSDFASQWPASTQSAALPSLQQATAAEETQPLTSREAFHNMDTTTVSAMLVVAMGFVVDVRLESHSKPLLDVYSSGVFNVWTHIRLESKTGVSSEQVDDVWGASPQLFVAVAQRTTKLDRSRCHCVVFVVAHVLFGSAQHIVIFRTSAVGLQYGEYVRTWTVRFSG